MEYQRSWHLAILISSAHVYPFSFQHFYFDSACPHFFITTSLPHNGFMVRKGYLYPQTHNRFQTDQLSHPAPEEYETFYTWGPIKDRPWLFHFQHLDRLGRRHIPVDWRRVASRRSSGPIREQRWPLQLGRQLVEVIYVWDVRPSRRAETWNSGTNSLLDQVDRPQRAAGGLEGGASGCPRSQTGHGHRTDCYSCSWKQNRGGFLIFLCTTARGRSLGGRPQQHRQ